MIRRDKYLLLLALVLIGAILRFFKLDSQMLFFGDQAWYVIQARDALLTGNLPLLGITASITWIHQGPLWTYFLVPTLVVSNFSPYAASYVVALLGTLTVVLLYSLMTRISNIKVALTAAVLYSAFYFSVIHSRLSYHTSLIPVFLVLALLLLQKKQMFLSGLFLGFLYQSHLLTFVYWPLFCWLLVRKRYKPGIFLSGFIIGILPFILSGPIATGGIFLWFLSRVMRGISDTTLFSESYLVVFSLPVIIIVSLIIGRLKSKLLALLLLAFIILNSWFLIDSNFFVNTDRYGSNLREQEQVSRLVLSESKISAPYLVVIGRGAQFRSTPDPYIYLAWWLHRSGIVNSGEHSRFLINNITNTYLVLE